MFEKRINVREMYPQKLGEGTHKCWNGIQTGETQEKRGQLSAQFGQNSGHSKMMQGWIKALIQINLRANL